MMYELERMTHPEVAGRLADGVDTIIVPLGATENHGYHAPLRMDSISVDVVGRRAAEKLNCFYAPLMPYGMSVNHMHFKGTMSLNPTTMAAVVRDLALSLAQHGFRHIIMMTAHGGNFASIQVGADEARTQCNALIGVCNYFIAVKKHMAEILGEPPESFDATKWRSHAGTFELALAMLACPEDVNLDQFVYGDLAKVHMNEGSTVRMLVDMEDYHESGAFGGIDRTTPELGRRIVEVASDAVRDDTLRAIETFCECKGAGHASRKRGGAVV